MGPWGWSISGWLALMRGSSRAALWPSRHRFRYRIVICWGAFPVEWESNEAVRPKSFLGWLLVASWASHDSGDDWLFACERERRPRRDLVDSACP